MVQRIHLDYYAGAPLLPEVKQAMGAALEAKEKIVPGTMPSDSE